MLILIPQFNCCRSRAQLRNLRPQGRESTAPAAATAQVPIGTALLIVATGRRPPGQAPAAVPKPIGAALFTATPRHRHSDSLVAGPESPRQSPGSVSPRQCTQAAYSDSLPELVFFLLLSVWLFCLQSSHFVYNGHFLSTKQRFIL